MNLLAIFIGGGIGSVLRWLISNRIGSHWGIMTVNIIGAFLIGCAFQYFASRTDLRPAIKMAIMTGFLGGFTTFSTYLLDFTNLLSTQKTLEATSYLFLSLFVGVAFLLAGMRLTKLMI